MIHIKSCLQSIYSTFLSLELGVCFGGLFVGLLGLLDFVVCLLVCGFFFIWGLLVWFFGRAEEL